MHDPADTPSRLVSQWANDCRKHTGDMIIFLTILVGLAMLGTVGVLLAGILGMVRGGGDPTRSNRLMRYRVLLQGAALLLFAVLMTLLKR